MKKAAISIFIALAATIGIATLAFATEAGEQVRTKISLALSDVEYVKESPYPLASGSASMLTYADLAEMKNAAVLIAEVQIQDQKTVYLSENPASVETWSEAEIKQVLKGDTNLQNVTISEFGGVIDMSKSKGNEPRGGGQEKPVEFIEDAPEGSPVMKKGNTYFVLLKPGAAKDTYTIVGTVQGKIRIDNQTDRGVVTVDPERFIENTDLFWFQHKFAGKDKSEIAEELKK